MYVFWGPRGRSSQSTKESAGMFNGKKEYHKFYLDTQGHRTNVICIKVAFWEHKYWNKLLTR